MRVLCTSIPAWSHMLRTLEVARTLASFGHEVRFATAGKFAERIASAGVAPLRAGLGEFPVVDMSDPDEYARRFQGSVYPLLAQSMYDELRVIAQEWRPDVVVRDFSERGAALLADLCGIPHLTVNCTSTVIKVKEVPEDNWYNTMRKDLGLDPATTSEAESPWASISFQPREFHTPGARFPDNMMFARYEIADSEADDDFCRRLFAGATDTPRVLVTMGTVVADSHPALSEAVNKALEATDAFVVVTCTGSVRDVRRLGDRLLQVSNAPVTALMNHVDLVVNHGGINTVLEGLAAGKPSVVVPVIGDQFYTGERCAELGAGLSVSAEDVPVRLSHTVQHVIDKPAFTSAAGELGAVIAKLPSLSSLLAVHPLLN
jgi:UDP:flavonoid glycosyltransferase YjiC (YdhE family)